MVLKDKGISVKDVDQHAFVRAMAAHLKKGGKLRVPTWVDLVKLSSHKQLAPYDDDWFYTRCASVLRHLYIRSPVGVGALAKVYGGRKRRGVRPSHFVSGSSSVARKALQELEKGGWVEKDSNDKGRVLAKAGRRDCDRIANQLAAKPTIRLI